ncbi:MAG: hypothetical protein WCI77_01035 [Candidatus Omnitrophota bacterium]
MRQAKVTVQVLIFLVIASAAQATSGALSPLSNQEGLFSLSNGNSFNIKATGLNGDTCVYEITYSGYVKETGNLDVGCSYIYKYPGSKAILTHKGFNYQTSKCEFTLFEYTGSASQWSTVCNEDCSSCSSTCPCTGGAVVDCNECEYTGYDCTGNTLYYCTSQGNCIVRELVDVCGENEVCDPTDGICEGVGTPCPYECCKYTNAYLDKNCPTGYACSNYQCIQQCTNNAEQKCFNGNVYWYDSCGNKGNLYDTCGSEETCNNGYCSSTRTTCPYGCCDSDDRYFDKSCSSGYECKSQSCEKICTSKYSTKCYNNDVYYYDSCGSKETIKYDCKIDEKCNGNYCVSTKSACPHECCIGNQNYFDKSCPGKDNCENNKCIEHKGACPYGCCDIFSEYEEKTCEAGFSCLANKCEQMSPDSIELHSKIKPHDSLLLTLLDGLTGRDYSEQKFNTNLRKVYEYVSSIPYRYDDENSAGCIKGSKDCGDGRPGIDYSQEPKETISENMGDCEDHAILLQSMNEALFYKTYGTIPKGRLYLVCGCIDFNNDGEEEGCHCWNIILDDDPLSSSGNTNNQAITREVLVGDVGIGDIKSNPRKITVEIKPYVSGETDKSMTRQAVLWNNKKWNELESTWKNPFDFYVNLKYPFSEVWYVATSEEFYYAPDFTKIGCEYEQRLLWYLGLDNLCPAEKSASPGTKETAPQPETKAIQPETTKVTWWKKVLEGDTENKDNTSGQPKQEQKADGTNEAPPQQKPSKEKTWWKPWTWRW